MIARRWRGWAATPENADAYEAFFNDTIRPQLERLTGFEGASIERMAADDGRIELDVVTRWGSYDQIRQFSGDDIGRAVVEPEAQAVLDEYDTEVRYMEMRDDPFANLELIDIPAEADAHDPWYNRTLSQVNDSVVRLGVIDGDFHWHKHDDQDEFFMVLDGRLLIDIEGADTIELAPHEACTVPRGVVHRTRAPEPTSILMVEAAGVLPTGD